MTEREVILVKKSWQSFRNIEPAFIADLFYSKLFMDNPRVRKMFPKNMNEQYQKLIAMLSSIVMHAADLSAIDKDIRALGQRHQQQYHVKPAHYNLVKNALLYTLERGLEDEWTDEVKQAWISCYSAITSLMLNNHA